MRSNLLTFSVLTLLSFNAFAFPGRSTTPQALGLSLTLRPAEQAQLVLLEHARISGVEAFHSRSGKDHLRFRIAVEGASYAAIEFDTPYTQSLAAQLQTGPVRLVGVWSSYQGQPSFTVMKVLPQTPPVSTVRSQTGEAPAGALLRIDAATISVSSIEKYTSAAHKVHVLYSFTVGAKNYRGILYDGTWTSKTLATLRSGHATLYGSWSTYRDQPSFVTTQVSP